MSEASRPDLAAAGPDPPLSCGDQRPRRVRSGAAVSITQAVPHEDAHPRGGDIRPDGHAGDEPWAPARATVTYRRAYKGGLVLTATRVADGSGWTATVESPNVAEQSGRHRFRLAWTAQRWADSRAGGAR